MSGVAVIMVVAVVSVLAAVFFGAVVLNVREYRKVKGGYPIPVDLTDNLTLPEGLPWDRRFRGQPWPDPETGWRTLTAASAWRYAGAAETIARRRRIAGELMLFLAGLFLGSIAGVITAAPSQSPSYASAVFAGAGIAVVMGGFYLKNAVVPKWEAIYEAYVAAAQRIEVADRDSAPESETHNAPMSRFRAAWQAFFDGRVQLFGVTCNW